jgi:AraC-like DNA-binding protein
MQSNTYTDYDAFAGSLKDVDAKMMLQNPANRCWTINQAQLPNTHLQLGRLGSGNIVEGQSMASGLLIYVPVTTNCEYLANGTIYEPGSIVIFEPGSEFCVASNAQHDWCSIYLPTEMFSNLALEPFSTTQKTGVWVSDANRRAARQIFRLVRDAMTNALEYPEFQGTVAARHIEADLSRIAAEVVGRDSRERVEMTLKGRPKLARDVVIRHCKGLLERREAEPIHIDDLLKVAEVSERTLRRAFKEYFGIGPTRYLKLRQLHQVRRVLRSSDAETTSVTKVLFGQGVTQLGRFASHYRILFGELPSETLLTRPI